MEVCEIDFLSKFWSIQGSNVLMVELFLAIIEHRIGSIERALEDNSNNLSNKEVCFYSNARMSLRTLSESCSSLFPVLVNCSPKEFKDCMSEYFTEYSGLVQIFFLSTNFRIYSLSELQLSISFHNFTLFNSTYLPESKLKALDLISHYIVLLDCVEKIIAKLQSNGQQIGLNHRHIAYIIDEIRSIYEAVKQTLPQDPSDPMKQSNLSSYHDLMRQFNHLIEAVVEDYDQH